MPAVERHETQRRLDPRRDLAVHVRGGDDLIPGGCDDHGRDLDPGQTVGEVLAHAVAEPGALGERGVLFSVVDEVAQVVGVDEVVDEGVAGELLQVPAVPVGVSVLLYDGVGRAPGRQRGRG